MQESVYRRSVFMAVEILGDSEALARHLDVPPADVLSWLEGAAQPEISLFQRIVALIEASTVSAARTATVVRSRRDENR